MSMGTMSTGIIPFDPRRGLAVLTAVTLAFGAIAGQLVWLAMKSQPELRLASAETRAHATPRPDLLDRKGRILATDIESHSLYADPALLLDRDEAVEKLSAIFPDLNTAELLKAFAEPQRRFVWIRRGLGPRVAQRVHDLGLPGIAFRREWRRIYPAGDLAGHALGHVNIDNKGVSGLEKFIDDHGNSGGDTRSPTRITLDAGVQHAVADELAKAMTRYQAAAAAAIVMDATSGEIVAAASLPGVDPGRTADSLDATRLDRLSAGTYELGSIFKTLTVAMALERGDSTLDTRIDVTEPLRIASFTIKDLHPQPRPLTVREIFLHSSNVGAAMLAQKAGADAQRAFLTTLGLTEPLRTEAGPLAPPQLPQTWGKTETVTISYGHGIAVAPIQFASALATLVNGGHKVTPTYLPVSTAARQKPGPRIIAADTSARLRELMRLNVTHASGTGRRAETDGYRVGGKTGTAEMPGPGGYQKKSVIASFAAAFPMDAPRYVALVLLFEPQGTPETRGAITAGVNAAPVTARIVSRIAPLLDVLPRHIAQRATETPPDIDVAHQLTPSQLRFDAFDDAQ